MRIAVSIILCALLWVAPCAAADGRWFVTCALETATTNAQRSVGAAPSVESTGTPGHSDFVVLAPGVPPRALVRPRLPVEEGATSGSAVLTLIKGAPLCASRRPSPRSALAGPSGRARLNRICVLVV